jgi:hypothetical protein
VIVSINNPTPEEVAVMMGRIPEIPEKFKWTFADNELLDCKECGGGPMQWNIKLIPSMGMGIRCKNLRNFDNNPSWKQCFNAIKLHHDREAAKEEWNLLNSTPHQPAD